MIAEKNTTVTQSKKTQKRDYHYAVGRQKESVARIRLYRSPKEGLVWGEESVSKERMLVNGMPVEKYFPGDLARSYFEAPLKATNMLHRYAISVKVTGGGKRGQLGAVVMGIARALDDLDRERLRPILKKKGFLTRDARERERRKVGTGGKARRQKQSPKR